MKTHEVIKLLSAQGQQDVLSASQWLEPMPNESKELLEKIVMGLQIVKYSLNRQTEKAPTAIANEQLQALERLKAEITAIIAR